MCVRLRQLSFFHVGLVPPPHFQCPVPVIASGGPESRVSGAPLLAGADPLTFLRKQAYAKPRCQRKRGMCDTAQICHQLTFRLSLRQGSGRRYVAQVCLFSLIHLRARPTENRVGTPWVGSYYGELEVLMRSRIGIICLQCIPYESR